jgi:hypothetical protein
MEIMMRAREASNPKLQFLNPDNPYHPIYKQVCEIITLNYMVQVQKSLFDMQVLEKKRERLKNPVSYGTTTYDEKLDVEESIRNLTRNLPSAAPGLSSKTDSSAQKVYEECYKRSIQSIVSIVA